MVTVSCSRKGPHCCLTKAQELSCRGPLSPSDAAGSKKNNLILGHVIPISVHSVCLWQVWSLPSSSGCLVNGTSGWEDELLALTALTALYMNHFHYRWRKCNWLTLFWRQQVVFDSGAWLCSEGSRLYLTLIPNSVLKTAGCLWLCLWIVQF